MSGLALLYVAPVFVQVIVPVALANLGIGIVTLNNSIIIGLSHIARSTIFSLENLFSGGLYDSGGVLGLIRRVGGNLSKSNGSKSKSDSDGSKSKSDSKPKSDSKSKSNSKSKSDSKSENGSKPEDD